jgi:hypothetical protein
VQTNIWLVETILGARTHLAGHLLSIEGVGYASSRHPFQQPGHDFKAAREV